MKNKTPLIISGSIILILIVVILYFYFFKKSDTTKTVNQVKDLGLPKPIIDTNIKSKFNITPGTKLPQISDMINRILTSDDAAGWKQWRADWGAHFGGFPTQITDDFKQLIFANAVTSTATQNAGNNYTDYIYRTSDTVATKAKPKGIPPADLKIAASIVIGVLMCL